MLIFTSKLFRDEIKHWLLIASLAIWASVATFFALKNNSKTILIGIEESETRIIGETNDRILQNELKNFVNHFINNYYSYDDQSFGDRISLASDLMAESLWDNQKTKLIELQEKLKSVPLSQFAEVVSMDKIDSNKVEAVLDLTLKSKLSEHKVKLKLTLIYSKSKRTESNPWGYQIEELSDATL